MACHAWSSEKMNTMFGGWRAGALAGAAAEAVADVEADAAAHDERASNRRMFFEDVVFIWFPWFRVFGESEC